MTLPTSRPTLNHPPYGPYFSSGESDDPAEDAERTEGSHTGVAWWPCRTQGSPLSYL